MNKAEGEADAVRIEAQAEDGTIHIAYTYQRRTIKATAVTEAWVRAAEGPLCQ